MLARALVALGFGVAAGRLLLFVHRHAETLFWDDQWDLLEPLFQGEGLLAVFVQQHGPHRQGLGGWLQAAVLEATAWDGAAIAWTVAALLLGAAGLALTLKHRLVGRLHATDAVIPLLFLSVAQFEGIVVTPNPAYGALPVVLLLVLALTLLRPLSAPRLAVVLALDAMLVFTGFGLLAGVLVPAVFALELRAARSAGGSPGLAAAGLTSSLLVFVLFFVGWSPAGSAIANALTSPAEVAWLPLKATAPVGRLLGLGPPPTPSSFLALVPGALGALAFVASARALLRPGPLARGPLVLALLLAFSALFAAAVAAGRPGIAATWKSRYVALMLPGLLALYVWLLGLGTPRRRTFGAVAFLLAFGPASLWLRAPDRALVESVSRGKLNWARCYLRVGKALPCRRMTGAHVHGDFGATRIGPKLRFLEENELNFFAPRLRRRIEAPAEAR